jgi:hypothetical protein
VAQLNGCLRAALGQQQRFLAAAAAWDARGAARRRDARERAAAASAELLLARNALAEALAREQRLRADCQARGPGSRAASGAVSRLGLPTWPASGCLARMLGAATRTHSLSARRWARRRSATRSRLCARCSRAAARSAGGAPAARQRRLRRLRLRSRRCTSATAPGWRCCARTSDERAARLEQAALLLARAAAGFCLFPVYGLWGVGSGLTRATASPFVGVRFVLHSCLLLEAAPALWVARCASPTILGGCNAAWFAAYVGPFASALPYTGLYGWCHSAFPAHFFWFVMLTRLLLASAVCTHARSYWHARTDARQCMKGPR